ncbi:AfsR/SARP family transcriptional regulator [Mycobacteroides abscessus]|uniref:AfsR/SARP family transcriptional regulator n=1 Tax=Mycobacteroides abscessus TaxID=36809 RepID=UPI000C26B1ED|nr:hypothetical protein [Mycobacteroides abscessus]
MSAISWFFNNDGGAVVDAAVATLGAPSEQLMAVVAEPGGVNVMPLDHQVFPTPPSPWRSDTSLGSWARPIDALSPIISPPRPLLLPLGATSGAVFLVNLEALSPLTLTGDSQLLTGVLRAWVLHLLLTPGRIVAAATSRLHSLPGTSRFITAANPRDLATRLDELGVTADVVVVDDPTATHLFPATTATISVDTRIGGWTFTVSADGTAALASLDQGVTVPLQTVTSIDDKGWGELLATFTASASAAPLIPTPASPAPAANGAGATAGPDPAAADTPRPHIWVQILGEPTVVAPDGREIAETGRRGTWTAIITYLATVGRSGASREQLRNNCWPENSKASEESVRQTLTRIRGFLGEAADGQPALPELGRGGRRNESEPPQLDKLHPAVITDWDRFTELVSEGPAAATDDELTEALSLVRGPVLGYPSKDAGRYERWAKQLIDTIIDPVTEAARELATRRRQAADLPGALAAAQAGLLANPQRQDLWRLAIECADTDTRTELYNQIRQVIPAKELEPATRKLLP